MPSGAKFVDKNGRRFLEDYDPRRMEMTSRALLYFAIAHQKELGNVPAMHLREIPLERMELLKKAIPIVISSYEGLGVDITKEPMEVGPTCHYIMGGVRVAPETGATRVPGLFAAGEVAGGMHGSNRLGGNSLSDLLVFGRRAGLAAAEYAKAVPGVTVDRDAIDNASRSILAPFANSGGEDPYAIQADIQECMQTLVGIVRTEGELKKALDEIAALEERQGQIRVTGGRDFNPAWHLALDLGSTILGLDPLSVLTLAFFTIAPLRLCDDGEAGDERVEVVLDGPRRPSDQIFRVG